MGLGVPCCNRFPERPKLLNVSLAGTTKAADVEEDIGGLFVVVLVVPETLWPV